MRPRALLCDQQHKDCVSRGLLLSFVSEWMTYKRHIKCWRAKCMKLAFWTAWRYMKEMLKNKAKGKRKTWRQKEMKRREIKMVKPCSCGFFKVKLVWNIISSSMLITCVVVDIVSTPLFYFLLPGHGDLASRSRSPNRACAYISCHGIFWVS